MATGNQEKQNDLTDAELDALLSAPVAESSVGRGSWERFFTELLRLNDLRLEREAAALADEKNKAQCVAHTEQD